MTSAFVMSACTVGWREIEYLYLSQTCAAIGTREDPHEFTNRANDPKYANALAEMRRVLKEGWRSALPVASSTAVIETRTRPR